MAERVLISSERAYTSSGVTARVIVEVFSDHEVRPPDWARDRAIDQADSIVMAMAPALKAVIDYVNQEDRHGNKS